MRPMKSNHRRTLYRLLGLAIPLALLAMPVACSDKGDLADGESKTESSTVTVSAPESEPSTVAETESAEESVESDAGTESLTEIESATETESEHIVESFTQTEAVTETETAIETETETESIPPETAEPVIEFIHPSVYPLEYAGAKTETVLYAADYGVKGDGVTDDGPAIGAAIRDAVERQATLRFEEGKTYLVTSGDNHSSGFTSPFALAGADGVTVDGGGSVFKFKPGLSFFVLTGCRDIRLCNMRFDYTESVYLVGTVKSVAGSIVTYTTDAEPYVDQYDYSGITAFSIAYNEGIQNRPHRFLSAMKKTASCEVAVTYTDEGHGYRPGDVVFLPNPGVGHVFGETVYIGGCEGALTMQDIQVHAASSFIFAIKGNDAEMYFENVDLVPADLGRAIQMVSWRDGFHCKDNRRPFHWHECDVGVLFDDVYNVSGTLGYITNVENRAKITVVNHEFYNRGMIVPFDCRAGDVVDVYNPARNLYCGEATVREVTVNPDQSVTLTLDYGETLSKVSAGCVVGNRETCAPGSTITDCRFTGTFRLLRNIRVERTVFDHLCTWIKVEGGVEGPLPGNVDFIDCTFNGGTMDIGTPRGKIASKIHHIGFWNCTFNDMARAISAAAEVTFADEWSEETLYTTLARKQVKPAVEITPTDLDLENGITYDWTRYTMPVPGGEVVRMTDIEDASLREKLTAANGFADHVLVLTGTEAQTRFFLAGMDATRIPALHAPASFFILTVDYYTVAAPGGSVGYSVGETATSLVDGVFDESHQAARASFLYAGGEGHSGMYIDVPVGMTVYIGHIEATVASGDNPTDSQLENGHTFLWSNLPGVGVTIGKNAEAMAVENIPDEAVKSAILAAEKGFMSGTVLHVNGAFGDFTGLTDAAYYTPGETYHLSIDAYIASPMKPKDGTQIYLLALDDTPGNRLIAEGLFTGEGFYHFELDWTVGKTGERSLLFYMNNIPAAYADVYIGDFTVTRSVPQKPASFLSRDDFHTLSADDVKNGYTFDFTEGNLLEFGHDRYANLTDVPKKTRDILMANGFGTTVYYCNENFNLFSLPDNLTGGARITVSMQIYDVKGNLATSGERGAFVMLHMQGGVQNSAEVHYTITPSDVDDRLFTLTFESVPPGATDDLLFYGLTTVEFYIGCVTVERG